MWSISKRQEWLWQKCAPRTEHGLSLKTSSLPPWVAARLMGWVWHNCSSSGGPDWFPSLIQATWPHFPCYSAGYTISSVQFSRSVVSDSLWPHEPQHARPPCPSPTLGVHPNPCPLSQWCHPTISSSVVLFSCPQSFPASGSALCLRWPKYWSFSFNISPSNEHPGLISFRMDWLDLLAVPGTLKSLLQHHSSKASTLRRSAFFIVQHSHPYMTTGKTIALTWGTFVWKGKKLILFLYLIIAVLNPASVKWVSGSPF